jgi:hypothetical protein
LRCHNDISSMEMVLKGSTASWTIFVSCQVLNMDRQRYRNKIKLETTWCFFMSSWSFVLHGLPQRCASFFFLWCESWHNALSDLIMT